MCELHGHSSYSTSSGNAPLGTTIQYIDGPFGNK